MINMYTLMTSEKTKCVSFYRSKIRLMFSVVAQTCRKSGMPSRIVWEKYFSSKCFGIFVTWSHSKNDSTDKIYIYNEMSQQNISDLFAKNYAFEI